jgi:hypothetical protein
VYRMMPTQCKKANMSTVNIYFKKKQLSLNEDKQADIVSEHHGVQYLRLFLIVLSVSQLSHWFIIYIPYFISSHPYIWPLSKNLRTKLIDFHKTSCHCPFVLFDFLSSVMGAGGSSVSIVTGLDTLGSITNTSRNWFSLLPCPDQLWGSPSFLSSEVPRGTFPRGKAARVWNWPLTCN